MRRYFFVIFIGLLVGFSWIPTSFPHKYPARDCIAIDGDTIHCELYLGLGISSRKRLRLLGVDTPELRAKDNAERIKAQEAKEFVQNKLNTAKDIQVVNKQGKLDKYGRVLVIMYLDGQELNQELQTMGYQMNE